MAGFKTPDFTERAAAARAAKQRALELLRDKPAPDPAVVEAKRAARLAREEAAAAKRAEQQRAREEAAAAKAAAAAEAAAAAAAAEEARRLEEEAKVKAKLTPEEQKAARDARYAARKARRK